MMSIAGRHLEQIDVNRDGAVMVVSSNLTGAFWDGALNYFPSCETLDSIYTTHVAKELFVGAADGLWADNVSVVIGTDEGNVDRLVLSDGFFVDQETMSHHGSLVMSVTLSSDGETCVSGGVDHCINITNLGEGRLSRRFRGHTDTVNQVCCHNGEPDVFLSCSADRTVVIWDSRQPKPASVLNVTEEVCTAVSLHNDLLAVGTESGKVIIRDWKSSRHPTKVLQNHSRRLRRLAFSPVSPSLLASTGEDGLVTVSRVDLLNTETLYRSDAHSDVVSGVAWHPVTGELLTSSWDSTILLHELTDLLNGH